MSAKPGLARIKMTNLNIQPILSPVAVGRIDRSDIPRMLSEASQDPDPANMFMRLSLLFYSSGELDLGREMHARAVERRATFRYSCAQAPKIRLLAIMGREGGQDNAPIEYLIEHSDVQMDLLFLDERGDVPELVPDHDVAIIALGESCKDRLLLESLVPVFASWPRPVINHPEHVLNCARDKVYQLLAGVPNVIVPETCRVPRDAMRLTSFPKIVRPVDCHAGKGLQKIDNADMLADYFSSQREAAFYVSDYVDYKSPDGAFRKLRIALIDGEPYICHLAISDDWIVHYIPAGMDLSASKRAEEQEMMENFDRGFATRHAAAFRDIHEKLRLDYVVLDCSETRDGRLLVFEADSRAWVHAVDPVDMFPYKPAIMQKAFDGFSRMLAKRVKDGA